jgi:hypothetical protein
MSNRSRTRALSRPCARKVAAAKPVIALFGGRTAVGARAASAHTGAVANDDAAIDAFCASCGIVPVEACGRLLIAAKAFGGFPHGHRQARADPVQFGGPGVICADRAGLEGSSSARCPRRWPDVLRQQLPPRPRSPTRSTCWPMRARTASACLRGGHDPRRAGLRHGADDPCRAVHGRCRPVIARLAELAARRACR